MTFTPTQSATPTPASVVASPLAGARRSARLGLAALAVLTVGSFVAPSVASAAPDGSTASPVASRTFSSITRAAVDDPIGDQAALALLLFREFSNTGDASIGASYATQRDAVAAAVAGRLEIDPARMQAAWAAADDAHQQALLAGLTQLGVPYRRNTSREGEGFDCSGLTTYAWGQAGITLARQSSAQIRAAEPRTFDTAQAGDLVQYPGHVMMWLGVDKAILHSPYPGRNVEVDDGPTRRSLKVGDPTL